MKTLRLHGPGDLRFHDEPIPAPNAGEILLRVTSVGICGSDLHWFHEAGIGVDHLVKPLILGHEFCAVTESGERMAVDPAIPCGKCHYCIRGDPNFCENLYFAGQGDEDGALREWVTWPQRCLFPLPDTLSDADGAMLEPLGIAIHAVDLAHLRVGMRVGVFGSGPIGFLIMQLARLAGASTIIATDVLPHRVEAAYKSGADAAYLVSPNMTSPEAEMVGKHGLSVVFEAAGDNNAVEMAISAASPGGKVIIVGIPPDDRTAFSASIPRRKGLTIKMVRRMKLTYPRAIQLVQSGKVDVRSLVTHVFPFDQSIEAYRLAERREGLKAMITL
jgi:L-iditol 2-dehydrogenase